MNTKQDCVIKKYNKNQTLSIAEQEIEAEAKLKRRIARRVASYCSRMVQDDLKNEYEEDCERKARWCFTFQGGSREAHDKPRDFH